MTKFRYCYGELYSDLVKTNIVDWVSSFGSPLVVYDETVIRRKCRDFKQAFPFLTVRYACKANTLGAILKIVKQEGMVIDAVSPGEVWRALKSGFASNEILFTSDEGSKETLEFMVDNGVMVNLSSLDDVRRYAELSSRPDEIAVRINPGMGTGHHLTCSTAGPFSKHGIYYDQISELKKIIDQYGLQIIGVHTHAGSGTDIERWLTIVSATLNIATQFNDLRFINLGGGFPTVYNVLIDSELNLKQFAPRLQEKLDDFVNLYGDVSFELEPGRYFVADSGYLIGKILGINKTPEVTFVRTNIGFNNLARPALYGAYHPIAFLTKNKCETANVVVAGNLCESGDVFTRDETGHLITRDLALAQPDDLIVISSYGAYGSSMQSNYNSMLFPIEILIDQKAKAHVIRKRQLFEQLVINEEMPQYLI